MNILDFFGSVSGDPYTYVKKTRAESGQKILGFFCSYAPEEIIHAAGAIPFRLFGTREDITLADGHLQSYCCSLVRGGLEDALNGSLDFLDGTVFPHTCDSIQRLSDIWRLNTRIPVHLDVVLPVKLDTTSARQYMVDVLVKFRTDLENALDTTITDAALSDSIQLFNRIRLGLKRLYEMRSQNPDILPPSAIHRIMKAGMIMERSEFLDKLETLVDSLPDTDTRKPSSSRKRIMLSGGICNHPDIYDLLAEAGGDVIWDDLCTGARYAEGPVATTGDPLEAIADRYIQKVVCPAKHVSNNSRGNHLVKTVHDQQVDGVIFLLLKFCDPHAFDYPYIKQILDEQKIANLLLEVEEQPAPEGQLRTRFETFMDML